MKHPSKLITKKLQIKINYLTFIKDIWVPVWKSNPPTSNPEAAAIAKTYEDWHLNYNNTQKIKPYDTTNTSRLIPQTRKIYKMIFTNHSL